MKIGIQLRSLRRPFREALDTASRLGASGVEIDARTEVSPRDLSQTARRQLLKLLEDLRLKVCAVSFRTRRGYNIADELDRRIAATKEAMKLAYSLGAPIVINHVGHIPNEPKGPGWEMLLESLRELGDFGNRNGALLAAETGTQDAADVARLLDALPSGAIGVNLDPGSLVAHGFSAQEASRTLGTRVLHVYASDAIWQVSQGRGREVPLGRGSVDLLEVLGTLEDAGYRGYYTIQRQNADDPVTEIGAAVQYLSSL